MLIYGAGGHARVVASILSACGEFISGVFDDNWVAIPPSVHRILGRYVSNSMEAENLIIAIGNNHDRRRVAAGISHLFGKAIHPTASIEPSVSIGLGTVIIHRAVVQAGSYLGCHVIVNTGAIIDHDCVLADFAHIGPGATLCGGVHVGECTLVGAGSVILPQVSIGKECVIGAGTVVVSDVPDFTTVVGNPARMVH
ncbi:acetyltransferase [Dyadobacter sp. CY261]|uniref:acetyltransferase n=1 Tax=Dyadobacter sp. CY261 TaxID=2907203 RepID=UPI001F3103C0|nr:acetyltransferase [Dyadobacter sp. CY261]MCF0071653.1 acetyltransferase [Dyadobacter sp. CY261]